jgi:hypothetical protein
MSSLNDTRDPKPIDPLLSDAVSRPSDTPLYATSAYEPPDCLGCDEDLSRDLRDPQFGTPCCRTLRSNVRVVTIALSS